MKSVIENIKQVQSTSQAYSYDLFKPLWKLWRIQGMPFNLNKKNRTAFLCYSAILNLAVSFWYPFHLCLMVFQYDTTSENIMNLGISVTCVACSTKFIVYSTRLKLVKTFERLLNELDDRISDGPEMHYFIQLKRLLRNIAVMFLVLYGIIGISAAILFIFSDEPRLLYPGWFPFDFRKNTLNLYLANMYQICGVFCLLTQNYVDDCFPAMAFCVLSGHIKILSIRVAQIGHGRKTKKDNEEELIKCIEDQKRLYELYRNIEQLASPALFIQFTITAFSICVGMVALLFYVTLPLDYMYYGSYCLAMPMQTFPTCYYGSEIQHRFGNLHRSIFLSNWVEQSPRFKKDMIIFTERSLNTKVARAGGMLRIHLDTFFSTCKGAYSLFAVILRVK